MDVSVGVSQQSRLPDVLFEAQDLAQTRRELESVRSLLQAGLREAPLDRAVDLARYLGVDAKLAGQITRALAAPTLETFAAALPPFRGLQRIAAQLPTGGRALASAAEAVRAAINTELGERWVFDGMLARFGAGAAGEELAADIEVRKSAYRCYAATFGHSAERLEHALIFNPSVSNQDRHDILDVSHREGIVRTLPHVPVVVYANKAHVGNAVDREPGGMHTPRPVFDVSDFPSSFCVPGWCAPDSMDMRTRTTRSAVNVVEVHGPEVGRRSRTDVAFARLSQGGAPAYRGATASGEPVNYRVYSNLTTPVALLEMWVLIEESIASAISAEFVATQQPPIEIAPGDAFDLPLNLSIPHVQHRMGPAGYDNTGSRFGQLISQCLEAAGWGGNRYVVHRSFVRYPLIQSTIWCKLTLPRREPT
ncbi:MAG: hypothetical protein AAGI30_14400 [Planctomycetota bacterium]